MMEQGGTNKAKTMIVQAPESMLRVRKTKLLVISGPLQGQEFLITKDVFSMGSGMHNDLRLEDASISKRHCEITVDEEGYRIQDLDSTNGTYVQGIRVTQAYLNPGAELTLGKTRLIFCPMQESQDIPVSTQEAFGGVLGKSLAMRRVFHLVETYSGSDASVMLTGETGTGKEILAEEIHRHSPRRHKPFIVIDCAALAKDLIESELFGHTRGAFTGASGERSGAFEHADGGTVFLDEIGDLSLDLQPKLLRVLEKREIRRVGSNDVRRVNVRIICATNRKMDVEVNEGRFREDLFYRLSVVPIELPPLRRRREDIPMLVRKFITQLHGPQAVKDLVDFDATMEVLKRHEWPGNVRELRNLVDLAFYNAKRPVDLSSFLSMGQFNRRAAEKESPFAVTADRPFKDVKNEIVTEFEKRYLQDLLARNDGNVPKSAKDSGIERAALQRLLKKYDL